MMMMIDFPVSGTWAAAYAEQGLTPPLPVGFPVDPPPPKWEPLPILDLNEKEWAEQGGALLELIGWVQLMAQTETPDVWHNHLPLPLPGADAAEKGNDDKKMTPLRPRHPTMTPASQAQQQQPGRGGWKAL